MAKKKKDNKFFNYRLIISTLVLLIIAFLLGSYALDVFKDSTYRGESIRKEDEENKDMTTIPDAENLADLSADLLNLEVTEFVWSNKEENPDDQGLFFISETNNKYLIYNIDANNIEDKGYSLKDYSNIWVNSEDDNFYAVINIGGETIDLSDYYILIRDETRHYASRVIFNCYEAKKVILKDTVLTGTLIAPNAHVVYDNTFLYGQVHANSYEGSQKFYREVLFTGYAKIMYDLTFADFADDAVRVAAIEYLMENDRIGAYSDYNRESRLRLADTHAIKALNLNRKTLSNLSLGEDLGYFENLEELSSNNNNLKAIELAYAPNLKRLYLDNNDIEILDLLRLTKLEELSINDSKIKEIDLSKAPSLYYLSAANSELETLDLTNLPGLLNLNVNNISIEGIDLSKNLKLVNLSFAYTDISIDDLDNHLSLEYIDARGTGVTSLGLERSKLKHLDVGDNQDLSEIDLTLFPNLTYLNISKCNFKALDINETNIVTLNASFNKIVEIDFSKALSLTRVEIYGDTLKQITTSKNVRIYSNNRVKIIIEGGIEEDESETP